MIKLWTIIVTILALFITGCKSSTQEGITHATRKQLLLVPADTINQQSALAYRKEIINAYHAHALNTGIYAQRVLAITKRLANQVGVFRPDATSWKWEVNTINSHEINAYCMPGGKIIVFTGIIKTLNLTDDELAAIIGHEISHALREHSREKISQQALQQGAINLIGTLTGSYVKQGMAALVGKYLLTLPFSRTMETEADTMGMELMARAGFNPAAAPNVWRKMAAIQKGKSIPAFMSTHPSDSERIVNLEKVVPTVQTLYETAIHNNSFSKEI